MKQVWPFNVLQYAFGGGEGVCKKSSYSLYACENAEIMDGPLLHNNGARIVPCGTPEITGCTSL